MTQIPTGPPSINWEVLRADAARALEQAARRRAEADRAAAAALARVREAVLDARRVGVSVRRCAELGGVSPSTVATWEKSAAEAAAAAWNEQHPVGTPVWYWPLARIGPARISRTSTPARVVGGEARVHVEEWPDGVPLHRVEPTRV